MRRGTRRGLRIIGFAPAAAAILFAAGCSSSTTPGSGSGGSFSERFAQAIGSGSATPPPAPATTTGTTGNLSNCPPVSQRQGAGTMAINTPGRDPSAMQLRYQVAIVQTSRECANVSGNLVVRVGVFGRLVLGPAGGPGALELPLRYAVVEEGPQPKTLWTKMVKIPIAIADGQQNVTFTHIEEGISVPMPTPAVMERYVVYVGFDPVGAQEKKPPAKKRPAKQS